MSDEYPGEEPGTAAPTWAAVPTMPWSRVPEQRRDEQHPSGRGGPEQHAGEPWGEDPAGRRPQGRPYGDPRQQGDPRLADPRFAGDPRVDPRVDPPGRFLPGVESQASRGSDDCVPAPFSFKNPAPPCLSD